jgi:hypothetical protein
LSKDSQGDIQQLVFKELHMITRTIMEFKDDIGRSIWHLEKRVESIQAKLGIDPVAQRAEHHGNAYKREK